MVYLEKHLAKYLLMQIEDVLKLYMQGILGPGHLVSSFDNCFNRINAEYQLINEENDDDLIEAISEEYVRIYLFPYYKKEKDFTLLVKAFIKSSELPVDIDYFKKEVRLLENDQNKEFIEKYLSSDNYLISHSDAYKQNYKPHYLVIAKQFLEEIFTYK